MSERAYILISVYCKRGATARRPARPANPIRVRVRGPIVLKVQKLRVNLDR